MKPEQKIKELEKENDLLKKVITQYNIPLPLYSVDQPIHRDYDTSPHENLNNYATADTDQEQIARLPYENPYPVLRVSSRGKVIFANQSASALLYHQGSGPDQKIPDEWVTIIEKALKQNTKETLEISFEKTHYSFSVVPVILHNYVNLYGCDITELKKTEKLLIQVQRDLNHAQSVAQVGSWRLNIQNNQLIYSDENHRIFGKSPGDTITYQTFLDTVHPDDKDYVNRKWEEALKGNPYDIEHRSIINGKLKWIREKAELEFDQNGHLTGSFGISQDISDTKFLQQEKEKLLREKQQQSDFLQRLINNAPIAIAVVEGADLRYSWVNPSYQNILGPQVRFIGRSFAQVFPTTVPQGLEKTLKKVMKTGKPEKIRDFIADLPGKSASWWEAELIPLKYSQKTTDAVLIMTWEITERKLAEQALQESEKKFRTLADHISQFAWMADPTGWIFWYNKRWFEHTGTDYKSMEGWGWTRIHHPEYVEKVENKFRDHIQKGLIWEDTFPLKMKSGEYRWFLSRALPVKDEQGKITLWFGTNTDITHQKKQEEDLKFTTSQLQKLNELLQNLIYIAAHDLKSPIANLRLTLDLIHQEKEIQEKLDMIPLLDRSLSRLDQVIEGLTEILQAQNPDEISIDRFNPRAMILEILDEHQSEMNAVTATFNLEMDDSDFLYVKAFFRSILKNLITNAIKYKQPDQPLKMKIKGEKKNGQLMIMVKDNGIGMNLIQLKNHLFRPFKRFTNQSKGTGIGLYIIKSLLEKNGGSIEIKSEPNQGSQFYCYFQEYQEEKA
ncbi:MAG: PAS domain-containing protein [Candidatus Cyclobacteriaceae bacterium M3_2C_046]